MLFETAARLALIEALAPTAALAAGTGFPTLAGPRILDSRQVALEHLDAGDGPTRVIGVFCGEAESVRRGQASPVNDRAATCGLELVVELAVRQTDRDNQPFADADAANSADAENTLSAMVAQIRRTIETGPEGALFRKVTKGSVIRFSSVPHVLPEIGVRLARRFVSIDLDMADDCYPLAGGLPEPLKTLDEGLPADSYAKGQLARIAALFGDHTPPPLDGIAATLPGQPGVGAGPDFTQT